MVVALTTCYESSNSSNDNSIYKSDYFPCNSPSSTGFVSCCFQGHTCGLDGFCHFSSTLSGTSGYYLGGCTDPTFKDPSCANQCSSFPLQDVGYNSTSQQWACCYSNPNIGRNCSSPLNNVTFLAPSPNVLFAKSYTVVTQAATQSSTSVVSSATSSANTVAPTIVAFMDSNISREAVAGIAAGVGIGSVLILIILLFLFRHRRSKKSQTPPQNEPMACPPKVPYMNAAELHHDNDALHRTRQQLDSTTSTAYISELPGRNIETESYEKMQDESPTTPNA